MAGPASQEPMPDALELALAAAKEGKPVPINPIVPIVNKAGIVKEPRCGRLPTNTSGSLLVYWNTQEQRVALTKQGRDGGWEFYEDVCRGRYEPLYPDLQGHVPADKGIPYFKIWERMKQGMGQRGEMDGDNDGQPSFEVDRSVWSNEKHYHPEVVVRRAQSYQGRPQAKFNLDEFFEAEIVEAPDAEQEQATTLRDVMDESAARAEQAHAKAKRQAEDAKKNPKGAGTVPKKGKKR